MEDDGGVHVQHALSSIGRGACRWAFVQCVQMPQGTSVVVQWSEYGKEVR